MRPYCWSPSCWGKKQWLPEGEQWFPRTAVSCGSSGLAPLFASVFTGVGRELGAGHPGGRSAASLAPCALTLGHLPLLSLRRQSWPRSETRKASQARPPQLEQTSGYEKEPRRGSASGAEGKEKSAARASGRKHSHPCPTQTRHLTVPDAVRAKSRRTIAVAPAYIGDCPPNPGHKWSTHFQKHALPASARKGIRHCRQGHPGPRCPRGRQRSHGSRSQTQTCHSRLTPLQPSKVTSTKLEPIPCLTPDSAASRDIEKLLRVDLCPSPTSPSPPLRP